MRTAPPGILPAVAIDRDSGRPLYRQLYEGYREAIVERQLRPGQRLPSTRSLAAELRISRIPVLNAFEQLLAEGYFESRPGAGTFVAKAVPEDLSRPKPRGQPRRAPTGSAPRLLARSASLLRRELEPWYRGRGSSVGQAPVDHFPIREWSRIVARHARRSDPSLLQYSSPLGYEPLREAVAEYLRTARAVRCEAFQIMIVGGSQQGIDLTARVLLDAGSPAWLEDPGYFGMQNALRLAGARLVPVPVDEEGLVVSAGIARSPRARAAYLTPSHQWPLGVTMNASRRLRLLDWAQSAGAWIVEDDYDSEYRYGHLPVASLQGLDRDARVIYIGTFSKILFPALRIGYIVLPPDLLPAFVAVRRATDLLSSTFSQAVLTDFMREGHFARHVRRMRVLCGERREALVDAIHDLLPTTLRVLGDAAGMFLAAALPGTLRDREVSLAAARRELKVPPLSECYVGRASRNGLVIGYGNLSRDGIAGAVRRLRDAVDEVRGAGRSSARASASRAAGAPRRSAARARTKPPRPG